MNQSSNTSPASTPYDLEFFQRRADASLQSARIIVPIVLEFIRPRSVIDVGCGTGTWLKAFAENGVTDIVGLDGDYVPREDFQVDLAYFQPTDLTTLSAPPRRFDLALCLEVAEHLPFRCSKPLVDYLVKAAPYILFSAAIPGQGGTNHINEQWPSFWCDLFQQKNYVRLDPIRPRIWRDKNVNICYRQNVYLYVRADLIQESPLLAQEYELSNIPDLDLIAPSIILPLTSLTAMLRALPRYFRRALTRRLGLS